MRRVLPGPVPPEQLERFLDSFLYRSEAFLVDEIVSADREAGTLEARLDTTRPLPYSDAQRTSAGHHVPGVGQQGLVEGADASAAQLAEAVIVEAGHVSAIHLVAA